MTPILSTTSIVELQNFRALGEQDHRPLRPLLIGWLSEIATAGGNCRCASEGAEDLSV
jgi:hypothetical protein